MTETKDAYKQRRETLKATSERRKSQRCYVFHMKIQFNKLSEEQKEHLCMLFIEGKRLQNYYLSQETFPKKEAIHQIQYRDKDFNLVNYDLKYLSSQMKQGVHEDLTQSFKSLSASKQKGRKVGKVKFKKEYKSLNLPQPDKSYRFSGNSCIKIQAFPGKLRVNGLKQIFNQNGTRKYEFQNQKLLMKPDGYYLQITCFKDLSKIPLSYSKGTEIGLDMGVKTPITFSNDTVYKPDTEESERLKKLQRKFSKQEKGSKRSLKTQNNIRIEYQKMQNKKNDAQNKIVHWILQHEHVYMQDENLVEWFKRFGKQIHHSGLGIIKAKLINHPRVHVLNRFQPSTQLCTACGTLNKLYLKERTYSCSCGYTKDRDLHQAQNMIELFKVYGNSSEFTKLNNSDGTSSLEVYTSKMRQVLATL